MLSISKLSTGQHRYYLDQAGVRVDAVESVGGGMEDYYVGGIEAPGEWLGAGAREVALEGRVDGEELRKVLAGVAGRRSVRASRVRQCPRLRHHLLRAEERQRPLRLGDAASARRFGRLTTGR